MENVCAQAVCAVYICVCVPKKSIYTVCNDFDCGLSSFVFHHLIIFRVVVGGQYSQHQRSLGEARVHT